MLENRSYALGDTITLVDGSYTFVGIAGTTLRLRNQLTDQSVVLTHLELARLLPAGQPFKTLKVKERQTFSEVMEKMSEEELALLPHIQELADGTPPNGGETRPEYRLELPVVWRCDKKEEELAKLGIVIPSSSIKRKLLKYRKVGAAALIDGRRLREEEEFARVDPRVVDELVEIIASYEGQSSPTYTRIAAELRQRLIRNYDADDRPKAPSVRSVERYVKQRSRSKDPVKPGKRRETDSLVTNEHYQSRLASAPGDECQIDSTEFDAFVRLPDGRVKRPWLTVLLDKRTRSIVGFNFSEGQPNGLDHVRLLADALTPRPLRSWSHYYDQHKLPLMPWSKYYTADELKAFDAHRPYIVPRRILTDNGADFTGKVFKAAGDEYGIDITESPIKAPTAKAKVERHFGVINTLFAQYLPGYTQSNIQSRGKDVEKQEVLPLATVADLFERWVAIVWQNREHSGLVDLHHPKLRHTPNTMYAATVDLFGHFVVPVEDHDFISLMPYEPRAVLSDGIEINGRMYDSVHLGPMRNKKVRTGTTTRVNVHFDPGDPRQVWVRAENGEWITCAWSEERGLSRPLIGAVQRALPDPDETGPTFTNETAADMMLELRDGIVDEHGLATRAKTKSSRRKKKDPADVLSAVAAASTRNAPASYAFDEMELA